MGCMMQLKANLQGRQVGLMLLRLRMLQQASAHQLSMAPPLPSNTSMERMQHSEYLQWWAVQFIWPWAASALWQAKRLWGAHQQQLYTPESDFTTMDLGMSWL